jgi:hypothetical protein
VVVLDDECKPNVAVQVATKMAADKEIIAAATHYCSAAAIAAVDTYHKFGFPVIVWGAVLPDITYRNKYPEIHRVNGTMINQNDANARSAALRPPIPLTETPPVRGPMKPTFTLSFASELAEAIRNKAATPAIARLLLGLICLSVGFAVIRDRILQCAIVARRGVKDK